MTLKEAMAYRGENADTLAEKIGIRAGTVHILSPANRWGAEADPRVRYVTEQEDLNRSFPGDPEGNMELYGSGGNA